MFATTSRKMRLPPAAPTAPQIYSVPRLSGGYDYYQAPPGSSPPLGDDYPVPNMPHPNPIGISALHVGREMPPGCRKIGSGERAIGSVTAMPGAGNPLPNLSSKSEDGVGGLGAYGADTLAGGGGSELALFLAAVGAFFITLRLLVQPRGR